MEWWNAIGTYAAQFGNLPALAVDMAMNGPQHSDLGFALADKAQRTPAPIEVYPQQGD